MAQVRYPAHGIELIVPWGSGGGADQAARRLAPLLEAALQVPVAVVNVPGATGQAGYARMLAAPADGYTLELMTGDTFGLLVQPKSPIATSDFIPIGIVTQQASAFFVAHSSPWRSWNDVLAAAKTRPLKVAVTGFGSLDDITVSHFVSRGLKLTSVPYARPDLRYAALLDGAVDLLYEQPGDVRAMIEQRRLRPVLLFYPRKVEAFPDVPVAASAGYGVSLPQFRVVVVRAGTDGARVRRLRAALAAAATSRDFTAYLESQYADPRSFVPGEEVGGWLSRWVDEARAIVAAIGRERP